MDYQKYCNMAIEAAQEAGKHIKELWNVERKIQIKADESLLTQIDTENENYLRAFFESKSPDFGFLGEESGVHAAKKTDAPYWYVDPVDGTTNLAHRFSYVCVSIALVVESEPRIGVVYNPMQDQCFWAAKGMGAKLNGKDIHVSQENDLKRSLLATGFPVGPFEDGVEVPNLKNFALLSRHCHSIRRPGSAAIDLACVAAGYFDAFWEIGLKAWDTPAGCVLVREAGGKVTGFEGDPYNPHDPYIIASNGLLHAQLEAHIRKSQ